jgi:hypothetical protein
MAPELAKSFSVSVVLPASGCEMIAKVRRDWYGMSRVAGAVCVRAFMGGVIEEKARGRQIGGPFDCQLGQSVMAMVPAVPAVADALDADDARPTSIDADPILAVVALRPHRDDAAAAVGVADLVVALPLQEAANLVVAQAVLAAADRDAAATEAEMEIDARRSRLRRNGGKRGAAESEGDGRGFGEGAELDEA